MSLIEIPIRTDPPQNGSAPHLEGLTWPRYHSLLICFLYHSGRLILTSTWYLWPFWCGWILCYIAWHVLLAKHVLRLGEGILPNCLWNKSATRKPAGPLHPIPIPDKHGDSNVFWWFTRSQKCVEHSEEQMCVKCPVDVASLCWCFNLKINSTKFINTYLRPMVTHYKNQGQEKWDSCTDTCNLYQILQLPDNNSMPYH